MIYTLSKNNYTIQVATLGAELISLSKCNFNFLWTKSQPFWQRHAPVLFPIVGKLKDDNYFYNGQQYTLPQHGFARDSEFELLEINEKTITFRLLENVNENYPFQFDFFICYSLDSNGLKTIYRVENKGTSPLPFSVGAHPGFLCPFFENEKLEDYYFEFEKEEILNRIRLQNGLLTTDIETIPLTNKKLYLSESLFRHDALVLSGLNSKSVALKSEQYTLTLAWDDCTYLGLWKQPLAPFVCIEPWWGVADGVIQRQGLEAKRGINWLEPGSTREFWFTIKVG